MDHSAIHALEWLSSEGFMPHGHCYLWTPELLWTFVIAESVIVLSYFSIPFALMYFVGRRSDLHFNWIFKLFSLFIFACGTTHLISIWNIWHTDYWLDAMVTAATAAISLVAAIMIWPLIPQALKLPSTTQLEETVDQLHEEIGQRRIAEAELERLSQISDARFRIIFDQSVFGVAEVDSNTGKFLLINQKYCDLLGYSREEMLQRDFKSITHPDDLPLSQAQIRSIQDGIISDYTIEKRYLHKDGRTIWVTLTVSLLVKPEGAQPTLLATVQDITVRKQAEMAIKEQLDELRRWYAVTLGRENRVQELKDEVNALLLASGQVQRYASSAEDEGMPKAGQS